MKNKVRASLVQMEVVGLDVQRNLDHMCELIGKAAAEKAELIILPELSNSGYLRGGDAAFAKRYLDAAAKIPGPFTEALGKQAKKHGVYLVVGLLEAHPTVNYTLYNSVILIGPEGQLIGKHHKMHLPLEERHFFYTGNAIEVFDTELGKIGLLVCYDGYFPELPRVLTLKGAEIICASFNIPAIEGKPHLKERLLHVASCRGMENMNYFLAVNRVGPDVAGHFIGGSAAAGPYGQILAFSPSDKEEIINVTLDDEILREARVYNPCFRDRKPECYQKLVEPV